MTWHQVGQLGQQLCWFLLLLTPRFCKPGTSTYRGQIAGAYLLFVNAELTVLSCSVWVRLGLESPITQRKMQSLVTLATCNLSLSIVSTLLKRDYRICYLMIMWVGNREKNEWVCHKIPPGKRAPAVNWPEVLLHDHFRISFGNNLGSPEVQLAHPGIRCVRLWG